jgi:N-Acetylglucosaminyltransferase-IV (GnT-IV) conserved region
MSDEEMSDVLLVVFVAETNASHVESVAQKVTVDYFRHLNHTGAMFCCVFC